MVSMKSPTFWRTAVVGMIIFFLVWLLAPEDEIGNSERMNFCQNNSDLNLDLYDMLGRGETSFSTIIDVFGSVVESAKITPRSVGVDS